MRKLAALTAAVLMMTATSCSAFNNTEEEETDFIYYPPEETTITCESEAEATESETAEDSADTDSSEAEEKAEIFDTMPIAQAYLSNSDKELDKFQQKILDKASEVIEECVTSEMTPYEKELALHDWLIRNCTYDKGALRAIKMEGKHSTDPYGALINGEAVCMGYTTTFKLFMDMVGIPCGIVHSTDSEGDEHAWNTVQLDGCWYYVDATWDDPVPDSDDRDIKHQFFNITRDEIAIEHVLPDDAPYTESADWLFATREQQVITDYSQLADCIKQAAERGHSDVAVYFDMEDVEFKESELFAPNDSYMFSDLDIQSGVINACSDAGYDYMYSCLRTSDKGTVLLITFAPHEPFSKKEKKEMEKEEKEKQDSEAKEKEEQDKERS